MASSSLEPDGVTDDVDVFTGTSVLDGEGVASACVWDLLQPPINNNAIIMIIIDNLPVFINNPPKIDSAMYEYYFFIE